jgi:hypothetical protein
MRDGTSICTLAAALLAALGIVPLAAQAATIIVTTAGDSGTAADCTLRQAIVSMNQGATTSTGCSGNGTFGASNTINFATAAFPNGGTNTITLAGGVLVSNVNLTIDATANGNVTIDANHVSSVMKTAYGSSLNLSHLTLRNGNSAYGGGIDAGAITGGGSSIVMSNSTLSGNSATYKGGGISIGIGSSLLLKNSTLSGNSAPKGGGIYSNGPIALTDSTLSGNSASLGGGIFSNSGAAMAYSVTLTRSTLSGNSASNQGGGIRSYSNHVTVTLTNSTLSGNSAPVGAGICSTAGGLTLTNSTLSGNTATTSSGNSGGIYIALAGTVFTANNSIIGGNTQPHGLDVNRYPDAGANNLIAFNPKLSPLADNGGPTQTMLPQQDSGVINAISCTNAPPTDQRGMIRPDPASSNMATPCDAGAVEANSIPDEIFGDGFGP